MKTFNKVLMVTAFAAAFSLISTASAGLNGKELQSKKWMVKGTPSAPSVAVVDDGIAASPRLRAQINASKALVSTPTTAVATTSPANDGIAASPKFRQYLNEHRSQFQVAPLK